MCHSPGAGSPSVTASFGVVCLLLLFCSFGGQHFPAKEAWRLRPFCYRSRLAESRWLGAVWDRSSDCLAVLCKGRHKPLSSQDQACASSAAARACALLVRWRALGQLRCD